MKRESILNVGSQIPRVFPLLAGSLIFLVLAASAGERVHIHPQYVQGETLYYQIAMHTDSTGKTTTPIINPEGGTKFSENVDLLVRVEVMPDGSSGGDEKSGQANVPGAIRMRLTYERTHADSRTDALAFDAPPAKRGYDRLAGHSLEYSLAPTGALSDFKDTEDLLPKLGDAMGALSWVKLLAPGGGFPRQGISIGQKWTNERPLSGAPLGGLVWRTESSYLRNEPCRPPTTSEVSRGAGPRAQQCAVILTQFQILRHGLSRSEETPPDYVRHGLRTEGILTGSGESLDTFSLATGLLVTSTQTSRQRADFDIINAANGEKIHRAGQVRTQMVITSVSAPQAPGGQKP